MGVRANRRVLPATMENMYSNPLDHHDHGHREELQQVQRVKAITRDSSLSALEEATTPALVHTPPQLNRRSSKAKIAEPKGHVYGMVTVNGEVQAAFDPWKGAALQRERSAAPCSLPHVCWLVVRASGLQPSDLNGLSDAYVIATLGSHSVRTTTKVCFAPCAEERPGASDFTTISLAIGAPVPMDAAT